MQKKSERSPKRKGSGKEYKEPEETTENEFSEISEADEKKQAR